MKKMVYFLLFSIVRNSVVSNFDKKRQTTETTDTGCFYNLDKTEISCTRPLKGDYSLPENIFPNITKFELWTSAYKKPTLIRKIDTFQRFFRLTYLATDGYLKFIDELLELQTKQTLSERFFRIPTLSEMAMKRCGFVNSLNSEIKDNFVLPPRISTFTLENCSDQYFNWKKTITLKNLKIIKNDDFEKIPDLGYPSLQELDLHESQIFVSAKTLAGFCNLTLYVFDPTVYMTNENYCECKILRDWHEFLTKIERPFTFESKETIFECVQDGNIDCSSYTLDELKNIRNKCLSLKPPVEGDSTDSTATPESKKTAPFSWKNLPFWVYIILIFLTIAILFAIIMFIVEKWESATDDEEYEEEEDIEID